MKSNRLDYMYEGYGYDMGSTYIGGIWRGPDYPNGYNSSGNHKLRITVRNNITLGLGSGSSGQIYGYYLNSADSYVSSGPGAMAYHEYFISSSDVKIPAGVYEFDLLDTAQGYYGKYIFMTFGKATTSTAGYTQVTTMETLMNNIMMEII